MGAGRPQEGRLVHPQPRDAVESGWVVDQRLPVVHDCPPHGVPADSQVTSDRGDGLAAVADPPARRGAGPLGQRRPGRDRRVLLGPGPLRARRLAAAPHPLAPPQPAAPLEHRRVADYDLAAVVGVCDHPALGTADPPGGGLDQQLDFAVDLSRVEDGEAGDSEYHDVCWPTLVLHLEPPVSQPWTAAILRGFRRFRGRSHRRHSTLRDEEPDLAGYSRPRASESPTMTRPLLPPFFGTPTTKSEPRLPSTSIRDQ